MGRQATGAIIGRVVAAEGGGPLGYSTVSIPSVNRELFTNEAGAFTVTGLPAGPVRIRVRHIGFMPAELTITVHTGRADTVRVALTHVAVRLAEVRVHGYPPCRNPGAPSAATDPALAAIFDQLEQNADQLRLLAARYPFESIMERVDSLRRVSGEIDIERLDTIAVASEIKWHYAPGEVVERSADPRDQTLLMNVPSLVHFADPAFVANHCFHNGGVEVTGDGPLVRVDLQAAARIREPDVDGTMYLDAKTFQIRRSVLRLTHMPEDAPNFLSTEVTTGFKEVLPSIPVIASIASVSAVRADSTRPILVNASYESQRLLRVVFLKEKPGQPPGAPGNSGPRRP